MRRKDGIKEPIHRPTVPCGRYQECYGRRRPCQRHAHGLEQKGSWDAIDAWIGPLMPLNRRDIYLQSPIRITSPASAIVQRRFESRQSIQRRQSHLPPVLIGHCGCDILLEESDIRTAVPRCLSRVLGKSPRRCNGLTAASGQVQVASAAWLTESLPSTEPAICHKMGLTETERMTRGSRGEQNGTIPVAVTEQLA